MLKASSQASRLPFRIFGDPAPAGGHALAYRFLAECGVLLVQPVRPLRASDFDGIALLTDLWGGSHDNLRGLVLQLREFPGWENVGGFVRHVQFVREHHESLRRVAVATDAHVPRLEPDLADHFIRAELRLFGRHELGQAIAWAAD